ncbi:MAG: RdgB/HAM1 family non-canonical purine NTP pyrophosphatase [Pseudobdellovibrionaceae bacterium]
MEFWFATGNSGKLAEYKVLLQELLTQGKVQIHHQNEIAGFTARPEDGKTFSDNATIKARTLAAVKNNHYVFGEDSGLEVFGMDGLPGIHSARYAGPKAQDSENVAKLLKMMQLKAVQDRSARFFAALTVNTPKGEVWKFEGELKGKISKTPAGQQGFGYDPVFVPDVQVDANSTKTLAELGPGFKVQHSHRAVAFRQFLVKFKESEGL